MRDYTDRSAWFWQNSWNLHELWYGTVLLANLFWNAWYCTSIRLIWQSTPRG